LFAPDLKKRDNKKAKKQALVLSKVTR